VGVTIADGGNKNPTEWFAMVTRLGGSRNAEKEHLSKAGTHWLCRTAISLDGDAVHENHQQSKETQVKNKLWIFAAAVLAIALGSSAGLRANAALGDAKGTPEATVTIDNFSFSPATITLPMATTVRWTNADDIPHTVVSDDKTFKSKVLDTDEQFAYTFTKPGTYSYFCSIHPKMTGKIVVR
jgi:plastocyanin